VLFSFTFFRIIVFSSPREATLVPKPCTWLYQEERIQLSKKNKITLSCIVERSVREGLPYELLLVSLRGEYSELLECYVTYIHTKHLLTMRFSKEDKRTSLSFSFAILTHMGKETSVVCYCFSFSVVKKAS
jgi:hypothetical protein